jgi:hypothetical protein
MGRNVPAMPPSFVLNYLSTHRGLTGHRQSFRSLLHAQLDKDGQVPSISLKLVTAASGLIERMWRGAASTGSPPRAVFETPGYG